MYIVMRPFHFFISFLFMVLGGFRLVITFSLHHSKVHGMWHLDVGSILGSAVLAAGVPPSFGLTELWGRLLRR
jgi:hypothetical protein